MTELAGTGETVLKDEDKTKSDLIGELKSLRSEVKTLEGAKKQCEEAREAFLQYKEWFETISEAANDIIFILNEDGQLQYINSSAAKQLRKRPEEIIGKRPDEIFPRELSGKHQLNMERIFQSGLPFYNEDLLTMPDGKRWVGTWLTPIRGGPGRITGVMGISRDITERKLMEENLGKSEAQLATAQEMSNLGSWDADLTTKTVSWSDQLYRIVGLEPQKSEASLDAYLQTIHPDDRERIANIIQLAIAKHELFKVEHRIIRKDGAVRIVSAKGFVTADDSGRPVRVFGVAQDITEQKQVEEERERLIRELQEALANVKSLSGLLPICASCKKIRDDTGYWNQVEKYIVEHTEASFSHGMCPECMEKYYPEFARNLGKDIQ